MILTEERVAYRDAARAALHRCSRPSGASADVAVKESWEKSVRAALSDIGAFGVLISEDFGGSGAGFVDMLVLLEEVGRAGVDRWFLSSAVLSATLLGAAHESTIRTNLLRQIASGCRIVTAALGEDGCIEDRVDARVDARNVDGGYELSGTKRFVFCPNRADFILVMARSSDANGEVGLFAVDKRSSGVGLSGDDGSSINGFASVDFDGVFVPVDHRLQTDRGVVDIEELRSLIAVACCAEMIGGATRVLEMTTDYAKSREQFGQPIGSFQSVQHLCVRMRTYVQSARAITYRAGSAVESNASDRHRLASCAKAWTSRAYRGATNLSHRVHGAIGFSEEFDLQRYTKAQMDSWAVFGDPRFHANRISSDL
jgi:alkylation response protein AidB-like acyl-CoA dehydrogenase